MLPTADGIVRTFDESSVVLRGERAVRLTHDRIFIEQDCQACYGLWHAPVAVDEALEQVHSACAPHVVELMRRALRYPMRKLSQAQCEGPFYLYIEQVDPP